MGRGRTQRKHFRGNRDNVWKRTKSEDNNIKHGWEPFAIQNTAFDDYYKGQGIVAPEEWDTFMGVLRKQLPSAFRINSSTQFCADIRSQLENDFVKSLQDEPVEGGETVAVRPLPWYPDNLAWHSNFSRTQLRKNQTLARFFEFLKLENEIGNLTRQEAVSMVPPLFLDVQPHHFVLDMCAAPGSKTFQLLEIIHQSSTPGSLPVGMVVANDLDVQRCHLLIHQTKRMCTANLIVTNNEAQHFPGCRSNKSCFNASEMGGVKKPNMSQLLFDRVLCDVPCSGDGTLRKAPDIWRKWNAGMGNGTHSLQVQIAMRGVSLLKVGGRMVYSTCSMNPVEDEAVVAEILRRCGGSLELVDVSNELPQLARRPGLKTWKVRDKGSWLSSCNDVPIFRRNGIFPSMFPSGRSFAEPADSECDNGVGELHENNVQPMEDPLKTADAVVEEVSDFPLERCVRIMPHDQNTGAFFIAVFQKLSPLAEKSAVEPQPSGKGRPIENLPTNLVEDAVKLDATLENGSDEELPKVESEADLLDNGTDEAAEVAFNRDDPIAPERVGVKRKLQIQGKWKGVDPVVFFEDDDVINNIKTFYGIKESFPFKGYLVSRNSDTNHVKRIYYISQSVRDVLELNFSVGQQLKIASVGLKMFERQTSREGTSAPCLFRISSEGLPLILPYITKQILNASLADFKHLLQYKTIKFGDFVDAEFGEKASKLLLGCCVIILKTVTGSQVLPDPVGEDSLTNTIAIGCWKGRASLSVMVTEIDCQELLERLLIRMGVEKSTSEPDVGASYGGANQVEDTDIEMKEGNRTMEAPVC